MCGKEERNLNAVRKEQTRKHLHSLYTFRLSGHSTGRRKLRRKPWKMVRKMPKVSLGKESEDEERIMLCWDPRMQWKQQLIASFVST